MGPAWLISTIGAGDMSLSKPDQRRRFFDSIGLDPCRVQALRQVHSQTVLDVEDLPSGPATNGDGLVASGDHNVLSVTVADCLPILLSDPISGAFALCHSGWRGTGIVRTAVEHMQNRYGARPRDMSVVIGPGIGSCCYAVPKERYGLFVDSYGSTAGRHEGGRWFVDLRAANLSILEGMGTGALTIVSNCTACTPWLSSYRRQGHAGYVGMIVVAGHGLEAETGERISTSGVRVPQE
jgi:YfiH family protein